MDANTIIGELRQLGAQQQNYKKENRGNNLFDNLVNKHLDPKRVAAAEESANKAKAAGGVAQEDRPQPKESKDSAEASTDAEPQQAAAAEEAPAEAKPVGVLIDGEVAQSLDPAEAVAAGVVEPAKATGVDAGGSAEALLAEGAKRTQQQQAVGQLPAGAEAKTQKMATSEALRHAVSNNENAARANAAGQSTAANAQGGQGKQNGPALPGQVTVTHEAQQLVSRPGATMTSQAALQAQGQPQPGQAAGQTAQGAGMTLQQELTQAALNQSGQQGSGQAGAQGNGQQNALLNPNATAANAAADRAFAQQVAQQQAAQAAAGRAAAATQAATQAASARGAEGSPLPTQTTASTQGADPSALAQQQAQNNQQTRQTGAQFQPQTPLRTAGHNYAVADQLSVQIHKAVRQGMDRINIQLKPAELGRIDVQMEVGHDGRVQATIQAEKPETLDMLVRDSKLLEKALQDAGLQMDSGSLNFGLKGDPNNQQGQSEMARMLGEADGGEAAADEDAGAPGADLAETTHYGLDDGSVDIRV